MLLVEFDEGDLDATEDAVVRRIASRYRLSRDAEVASDPVRQSTLWKVRRSLFPTILQRPGPRKAWGFVEDPIVPRDRVPEFIAFLVDLTRRHGTLAGIYGHLGRTRIACPDVMHAEPLSRPGSSFHRGATGGRCPESTGDAKPRRKG